MRFALEREQLHVAVPGHVLASARGIRLARIADTEDAPALGRQHDALGALDRDDGAHAARRAGLASARLVPDEGAMRAGMLPPNDGPGTSAAATYSPIVV